MFLLHRFRRCHFDSTALVRPCGLVRNLKFRLVLHFKTGWHPPQCQFLRATGVCSFMFTDTTNPALTPLRPASKWTRLRFIVKANLLRRCKHHQPQCKPKSFARKAPRQAYTSVLFCMHLPSTLFSLRMVIQKSPGAVTSRLPYHLPPASMTALANHPWS